MKKMFLIGLFSFLLLFIGCIEQTSETAELTKNKLNSQEEIQNKGEICYMKYKGSQKFLAPKPDSELETFDECVERIRKESQEAYNNLFENGFAVIMPYSCTEIIESDEYKEIKNLQWIVKNKDLWQCNDVFLLEENTKLQPTYEFPSEDFWNYCFVKTIEKDYFEIYKCSSFPHLNGTG